MPFTIAFDYTLYTLTYVLVKGFGQVEVSPPQAASSSSKISSSAETVVARQADAEDTTGRPQAHQAGLLAGVLGKQIQQGGPSESLHGSARSLSGRAVSVQSGLEDGVRNTVNDLSLSRCPFEASPLPLPRDAIAAEPHMLSIYVHEATAACMLWAAHISGKLKYALVEGSIKDLHVTSDLLAQLIPELPKQYPGQFLRVEVETLDVPKVGVYCGARLHAVGQPASWSQMST